ncbi:hypothetical protein ACFC7A_38445 [Streptomyces niveus]|uniref:hypothetical protein n=1 Tax=Streptomyces niveus TaxID=193462 RepID=UPI0035E25CC6
MDQGHSRLQQYPWLPPLLLVGSIGLELVTPKIVSGAAVIAGAGLAAAVSGAFRDTPGAYTQQTLPPTIIVYI